MHAHINEGNYLSPRYILSPSFDLSFAAIPYQVPESRRDLLSKCLDIGAFQARFKPNVSAIRRLIAQSESLYPSIGLLLFFMLTSRFEAEPICAICVGT